MKRRLAVSVVCFLLAILVGCNLPESLLPNATRLPDSEETAPPAGTPNDPAIPASTVTAADPAPQSSPLPPEMLVSATSAITPTSLPSQTPTATPIPCNRAAPGRPSIDQTIQDGTRLKPGQAFTKTWRLVNTGSCPWTPEYSAVWFSGEAFGQVRLQKLNSVIKPGQQVDISVDMVAPQTPGGHWSNWKLRAADGTLYGLGPLGDSPFWVQIIVDEVTPTAQPEAATQTPTPSVRLHGSFTLQFGDAVNFDNGKLNDGVENDLILNKDPAGGIIATQNGSLMIFFGLKAPTEAECREATLNTTPVILQAGNTEVNICYLTNKGFLGAAHLSGLADAGINLAFTTWTNP